MVYMVKDIIRKADIVLGLFLLLFCAATAVFAYGIGESGADAVIDVNGELYGTYPLSQDRVIDIDSEFGHNQAVIADGKIYMAESDCPDSYCLGQHRASGGIDSSNRTIVCLPNRVVISVSGGSGGNEGKDNDMGQAVDGVSGGRVSDTPDAPDAVSGSPVVGSEGSVDE